jgi:hypothetical protein
MAIVRSHVSHFKWHVTNQASHVTRHTSKFVLYLAKADAATVRREGGGGGGGVAFATSPQPSERKSKI